MCGAFDSTGKGSKMLGVLFTDRFVAMIKSAEEMMPSSFFVCSPLLRLKTELPHLSKWRI